MCRDVGLCRFLERNSDELKLEVDGQIEKYQILKVVEFDSDRKRMSVVVQNPDGKVINFIKGADVAIIPRVLKSKDITEIIRIQDEFASKGLRTLLFGQKILDCTPDSLKEMPVEDLENNIELLGVTALEDLLQDKVADCIK